MNLLTGAELMEAPIGEREYAIHEMVPIGSVSILSAKKGRGKSVFTLAMAHAVASGRDFLGRPTKQGNALYVGSEDDEIELHTRYARLLETTKDAPANDLDITDHWPQQKEGGLEEIRRWCAACEAPRLVIIDLLISVAPDLLVVRRGWVNIIEQLQPWIDLARSEQIAIVLIVHNTRGPDFVPNPIEQVQGSGGLTAYAQTILVIQGRDKVAERQLDYGGKFGSGRMAVILDVRTMTCALNEEAEGMTKAETLDIRSKLEALVRRNPGLKGRHLASMLPGRSTDATVKMLERMAADRELQTIERRYYVPDHDATGQLSLADGVRTLTT